METLQRALIALYGSLGGDYADLDNPSDITDLISEIAKLGIGDKLALAKELPDLPDDDGTYTLQLVMDDGAATFTWEAATE